jgi:hypothetical protein
LEEASDLIRPAWAGVAYAILVFFVGFLLGTVRVLLVAPRVGPAAAVLVELPVILAASCWISRRCVARFEISRAIAARLVMGVAAFLILMLAEVTLAALLLGRSVPEYLASLINLPGAIGLAAQVISAAFPLLQALPADRPDAQHPSAGANGRNSDSPSNSGQYLRCSSMNSVAIRSASDRDSVSRIA